MPLVAALLALLLAAAPAFADTTTIYRPPATTPVTIPGTEVQRGDALTDGQRLLRRLSSVRSGTRRVVTLRCPSGTRHAGLGVFESARVGFGVVGGSYVGHQRVRVRVSAARGVPHGEVVRGSIFALCEPA